jgi:hypothetical protein
VTAALGAGSLPPGQLQALYVVKRGVSPRVVQALAISDAGATRLSGSTIRTALGLRGAWFNVRAMSISPGGSTTIAAGQRPTLSGTTYPALPSGTVVTLFYYRNGRWSSAPVASGSVSNGARKLTAGDITNSCSFTSYRYTVKPPATTKYYFATGSSQSPQMTVTVGGSPAPNPSPTATPAPATGVKYRTEATRRFRIRRGGTAILRYRVAAAAAAPSARAQVVIRIRRSDGRSVRTIVLTKRRLNVSQTTRFRCGLARGTYRYFVYAGFAGAGKQTQVGSNRFVVR